MAPKKDMALIVIPGSNTVPIPTERHMWNIPLSRIPSKRGYEWHYKGNTSFEFSNSESTRSRTPLSHHVYKARFQDNDDDEFSVIGSRSILRMRVEWEEVPWYAIRFEFKGQQHQVLQWAVRAIAELGIT